MFLYSRAEWWDPRIQDSINPPPPYMKFFFYIYIQLKTKMSSSSVTFLVNPSTFHPYFIVSPNSSSPIILGELLNYGLHFEIWATFWMMGQLMSYGSTFSLWVKLDLSQCECTIKFLPIWHWISTNVKLDFCICDIGFIPIYNRITSKMKLDFFKCDSKLLQIKNMITFIYNYIFITVNLVLP